MPDAVLQPAPVSTKTRRCAAIQRCSSAVDSVIRRSYGEKWGGRAGEASVRACGQHVLRQEIEHVLLPDIDPDGREQRVPGRSWIRIRRMHERRIDPDFAV